MAGPGHGAPGVLAPGYLEGAYSEIYPDKSEDERGLREFFKQFSFPGGIGSHCTPETPGSIHEGGELGYVLSHACGAAFDNPELIVAAVVGDGESETGPLATSWHISKFLNPIRDGAVLPILHLNGYKINNPTLLARISHDELESLLRGYGWTPLFCRRIGSRNNASGHGCDGRTLRPGDPRSATGMQKNWSRTPAALAHDRAPFSEGMGCAGRSGWSQARRLLACPPGSADGCEEEPRTIAHHSKNGCGTSGPRSSSTPTAG